MTQRFSFNNLYVLFFIFNIIFFPEPAYAYLDPGSGNALVYLVISLLGTMIYFAKNIFYALSGKSKEEKATAVLGKEHEKILIFSEGKSYWYTFKPILESFIEKKVPFSYITMDIHDPALTIDDPYMASKYIGEGSSAFAKASGKRALVMLSTTPNIGTQGFPMPRPKHVQCLAHIFHGVGDISAYHKHSLDSYDAALMIGDFLEKSIRTTESLRNLKAKECISLGLPYFDELARNVHKRTEENESPVILIAPSWGDKGLLRLCGTAFIHDIVQAGYDVIVRPHPQSWKVERDFLEQIQNEFAQYANVSFDSNMDGSHSLRKADLMISDKSGVRFDFALLYERPVITIDAPFLNADQYEFADLGEMWEDIVSKDLGTVVSPAEMANIVNAIETSLLLPITHFVEFRQKHIANFTKSGEAIADWAIEKVQQLESKA